MSAKRPLTPSYIFFYILFLPDTWQVFIGLAIAYFLTPVILSPKMGGSATVMLYIMLATIGYAGSRGFARWLTRRIKKAILADRIHHNGGGGD